MPRLSECGEWELLEAIDALVGKAAGSTLGIGDDAAATCFTPGLTALTTIDLLVEGVHFRRETTSAFDLGYKTLAVNLSDIAAMGGRPCWAVIGLALPGTLERDWVLALYEGLLSLARASGTQIVGGDTVRSHGGITIALTLVGEVATPLRRQDAEAGDVVFMTGPAGLAAAGFWCLEHPQAPLEPALREAAEAAHRRPEPALAAGQALARLGIRLALMDNSDGLARSALAIAKASGVDLRLNPSTFPSETATQRVAAVAGVDPLRWVLDGGEDYGLVGCVAPAHWPGVEKALSRAGRMAVRVGEVVPGSGRAWVQTSTGTFVALTDTAGFRHFEG